MATHTVCTPNGGPFFPSPWSEVQPCLQLSRQRGGPSHRLSSPGCPPTQRYPAARCRVPTGAWPRWSPTARNVGRSVPSFKSSSIKCRQTAAGKWIPLPLEEFSPAHNNDRMNAFKLANNDRMNAVKMANNDRMNAVINGRFVFKPFPDRRSLMVNCSRRIHSFPQQIFNPGSRQPDKYISIPIKPS